MWISPRHWQEIKFLSGWYFRRRELQSENLIFCECLTSPRLSYGFSDSPWMFQLQNIKIGAPWAVRIVHWLLHLKRSRQWRIESICQKPSSIGPTIYSSRCTMERIWRVDRTMRKLPLVCILRAGKRVCRVHSRRSVRSAKSARRKSVAASNWYWRHLQHPSISSRPVILCHVSAPIWVSLRDRRSPRWWMVQLI